MIFPDRGQSRSRRNATAPFPGLQIRSNQASPTPTDGDIVIDEEAIRNAVEFVDTFVDCLQLDEDADLSDEEIRHLEEMLSMSALVSAGRPLQEFVPRDFALQLRWDLNSRYAKFVGGSKSKYGKFRMEQGTVYLNLPEGWWWLLMGREDDVYYFDVRSTDSSVDVPKLGRLICERLGWDEGEDRETEDEYIFRFFGQSAREPRALDEYRSELFRRLDALTARRKLVAELCAEVAGG